MPISLVLGTFTSLAVVLRIKKPNNVSAITNPLLTFTVVLPPIYYPLSIIPNYLQGVAQIIPTVSLMEVARWIAGITIEESPIVPSTIVVCWIVATVVVLTRLLKWGRE